MVKRESAGPLAGQKDKREASNRKYYSDIKKEHYSPDFFSFKDSAVIENAHTYAHIHRLFIYLMHPTLASVGPDDGIAKILTDIYEQGHISGHMKDIGATELASAIDYCEGLWEILGQLRNEMAAVTLLDNPTYDDASITTGASYRPWKPETFNTFVETLEARNLIVPNFLTFLLDKFTGIRMECFDGYEIYGTEIPASYFVFGCRLNTLAVMEASRETMVGKKGEAIQFFNKFGIGYTSFTGAMATKVTDIPPIGPQAAFFFDTLPLEIRGKAKDLVWAGNNNPVWGTADWTAWATYLYDGQVPEELAFTQIFNTHDATHNYYGGLFTYLTVVATEGYANILYYAINAATPTTINVYTNSYHKWLPFCWFQYGQDDKPAAGEYELAMVGTELTANLIMHNDPATYPISRMGLYGVKHYKRTTLKTISKTALNAFLLKKMIKVAGLK